MHAPPSRQTLLFALGVGIMVIAFGILKTENLAFYANDHGIYLYASHLFAEGIIPYRDFFFSHPPFQILLSTALVLLFGMNFTVLDLLPALISALSGVLLSLLFFRVSRHWWISLLPGALFLFSHVALLGSLSYTGHNLAVLLLIVSTFLFLTRHKFWSGITAGLAVSAGVQVVMGFFVLCLLQFLWRRKRLMALLGGFAISFGALHLLFLIIGGWAFIDQTYLYHLTKPDETVYLWGNMKMFGYITKANPQLILLAIAGIPYALWQWFQEDEDVEGEKLRLLSAGMCVAFFFFLIVMHPIFSHYFLPLIAFAALLGADMVWCMYRRHAHVAIPIILIILATLSYTNMQEYYEGEKRITAFTHAEEVAERLQELVAPDETIFGDFGIVPLLALLSNRRVAADEIDTSAMRFISKRSNLNDVIRAIEEDNVKVVVGRVLRGIPSYMPFKKYLEREFFLVEKMEPEHYGSIIEIWLRK